MIILSDLIALLQNKRVFLLILFLPAIFYAQGTFNYRYDRYNANVGMECARVDYNSCKGVKMYDIKLSEINDVYISFDTLPWSSIFPKSMRPENWKEKPGCLIKIIPRSLIVWQKITEVPYVNGRMVYECDDRIIPISIENIYSIIPLDTSVKRWQRILLDQLLLRYQQLISPEKVQKNVQAKSDYFKLSEKRELRKSTLFNLPITHLLIGDEKELLKIDSLMGVDHYSFLCPIRTKLTGSFSST